MRLKDLTQQYNSIKPNSVLEKKTEEMLLDYFKHSFYRETKYSYRFNLILKPALVSLLVLFFIFSAGWGTMAMAKNALPGSILYPVKKIAEKGQMMLAFNASKKSALRAEILTNRFFEFKVLSEKLEQGNGKSEQELNLLAEDFTRNLKVLKQEIEKQIPEQEKKKEIIKPFPEEKLLETENINIEGIDNSSLPVQDEREIYKVIPTPELEKLLAETKELLAEENLVLAFARLQEMEESLRQPQNDDEIVKDEEPAELLDDEPVELPLDEEPAESIELVEPIEPIELEPVEPEPQQSPSSQPGSVGNILFKEKEEPKQEQPADFQVRIKKESPIQTGIIREE